MSVITNPYRITIEAVGGDGRALAVMFTKHRDFVEVSEHPAGGRAASVACLDRDQLNRWLAEPDEPLVVDDLTMVVDYGLDRRGRLAITTRSVLGWVLSPRDEAEFNRHL